MLQVFPKSNGCGLRLFHQPDSQYAAITCGGSPGLPLKDCVMHKLTTQERSQKCIKRFDQWEEDIEDHLYGRVRTRVSGIPVHCHKLWLIGCLPRFYMVVWAHK